MSGDCLGIGDVGPLFALPDTAGDVVRLEPDCSAATVLVFTAIGCPYARAWHDRIQAVARDVGGRGGTVLQIVSNDDADHPEDSVGSLRERVAAGDFAGPLLHDAEQSVAQAYGATATPEVFVLDRTGVVRYHGAPDADYAEPSLDAAWLREALDDVLAGRQVARPTTSPAGCSIKWRVELLWWEGCPTHHEAAEELDRVLEEIGKGDVRVVRREVRTRAEAQQLHFPGSPTFHVGGRDLFPTDAAPALTCRVYQRAGGIPSPLPDTTDLTARLRHVLARPWELPGWVDFRARRSAATPS